MNQSKQLGISKACPECKKTLIAAADIEGIGTFKTKCPHCGNLILIEIGHKTTLTMTKILIALLFISGGVYMYFDLNIKLDSIQKSTQAISSIIQGWDIHLNQ